jgi:hypothetical protein
LRASAQLAQARRRHSATGSVLRDAVPDLSRGIGDVVQVEAPDDGSVLVDEEVEDARTAVLVGEGFAVVLCISLVEVIAAVVDQTGEVRPVCHLEGEHGFEMIATKPLQFAHTTRVSRALRGAPKPLSRRQPDARS